MYVIVIATTKWLYMLHLLWLVVAKVFWCWLHDSADMILMGCCMLQVGNSALIIASCNGHAAAVQALVADARLKVNLLDKVRFYCPM